MFLGEVRAEQFLRILAPEVRDTLTAEQEEAIREAVRRNPWENHPVDLRLSLPTPFGRYYLTLVAGRDRRSAARRSVERQRYPLLRPGNLLLLGTAVLITAVIIFAP